MLTEFGTTGTNYTVISSQYLAGIDRNFPPEWKNIMIPPDNKPQDPVGKYQGRADTTIWAVNSHVHNGVARLGLSEDQIIDTGLLLPNQVYDSIAYRLDKQDALDGGTSDASDHVLVTIGASGPEIPQALHVVEQMLRDGIDLTIHCGDGRDISIQFRRQIEAIYQRVNAETTVNSIFNVTGGQLGQTREDDLNIWMHHLMNADITTALTRPNEMLNIAPALGMSVILLDPFQFHENYSHKLIISQGEGSNVSMVGNTIKFIPGVAKNYESPNFWLKATPSSEFIRNERAMQSLGIQEI